MKPNLHVSIIGNTSVGKTSLISRIIHNDVPPFASIVPTAATACYLYQPKNEDIQLEIWDTAGMERFRSINKIYYRDAVACILTFDLTDRISFESLESWKKDFETSCQQNPICIVVGNKCDLEDQIEIVEEEASAWANKYNFLYFSVSALSGEGVNEMLDALVKIIPRVRTADDIAVPDLTTTSESNSCSC